MELSRDWTLSAEEKDIKAALLQCMVKAVEEAKSHLTRMGCTFHADELIVDLRAVANEIT